MNKPLTLIAIFITTLVIAGTAGIAASTADTGSQSSASVGAETASAETPENTAQINAYLTSLEQQRQLNEFLQGENQKIEEEKAAKRPAPSTQQTTTPKEPEVSAIGQERWDQLAQCESGGDWAINTGNGFTGGLQFVKSTWLAMGGGEFAPDAYLASKAQQIVVAERLVAASGWNPWPGCTAKSGWR